MINTLSVTKTISNWQSFIRREKKSNQSPIAKKISRLKKELDLSFPEFGDMSEITATYNSYRELETLEQKINSTEE